MHLVGAIIWHLLHRYLYTFHFYHWTVESEGKYCVFYHSKNYLVSLYVSLCSFAKIFFYSIFSICALYCILFNHTHVCVYPHQIFVKRSDSTGLFNNYWLARSHFNWQNLIRRDNPFPCFSSYSVFYFEHTH